MDLEPEVARHQMEETRASLSDKLESLEQQVLDTVQDASTAVSDTVDNVKDAVEGTVKSVQNTLNLRRQVRRHPWAMMVGSIALGYVGGYFLYRSGRPQAETNRGKGYPEPPESPRPIARLNGVAQRSRSLEEAAGRQSFREVSPGLAEPGWLGRVSSQFEPEIARLKGMAIGTVLSAVRDLIVQSVPSQMKPELVGVLDSITTKLGGEPGPTGAGTSGDHDSSFRSP